jgi:carbon-monoxide dehydrogenase small subunit
VLTEPHRTLLDVLRDDLGMTGTKTNCLAAECGVCTVLVDGAAVNACLVLVATVRGRAITTIEGLAREHPAPTTEQIREALSGNLCRCTGYGKIVDAVADAARRMA